jgi:putative PIN family toxin of toxin-antitoxin system
MRVVIDTCVWCAAVRSNRGASHQLLRMIGSGSFVFGVSVPLYLEYAEQLHRLRQERATALSGRQIESILAALAYHAEEVPIYFALRPNLKDANDDMVFECAANYGARHIVTFNVRDFAVGELAGYGIDAIQPGDFLALMEESQS